MRLDKSQKQVISRHLLIGTTVLLWCPFPLSLLAVLQSFQISSEKASPLIHSPEEPGPPTLSTVPSNLALSPWGWPCCSVFLTTDLEAKPGHLGSPAPWIVSGSRWLLPSGLSTENHQMAFYNKDQDCFNPPGQTESHQLQRKLQ